MLLNGLAVFFLVTGLIFFLGGAIGIIRMPDFYSRLHPAGKLDTLGIMAMVIGLVLINLHHFSLATVLLSIKMLLIVFFVFMSSPTATHSIVDAGMRAGLRPWTRKSESSAKGKE
ncbi:monovalent cation/H(+) antiporter subunit G [Desulfospira joergensenii]|uniref:monovalent cation/H(+) antiporter subunit G n=1 Tax=Desulfospira joergensenii TaxID=53329 RepID=UPI0003B75F5A|nr:monovalent cation/H(+) antiporter subunit G [Desulfospira joergensenii]